MKTTAIAVAIAIAACATHAEQPIAPDAALARPDGSEVIFPKGQLYYELHGASDGIAAKELIMSLVGMAPDAHGGEGEDYYADYTPAQLAWANAHWEALAMEREYRYCDDTGSVRR